MTDDSLIRGTPLHYTLTLAKHTRGLSPRVFLLRMWIVSYSLKKTATRIYEFAFSYIRAAISIKLGVFYIFSSFLFGSIMRNTYLCTAFRIKSARHIAR